MILVLLSANLHKYLSYTIKLIFKMSIKIVYGPYLAKYVTRACLTFVLGLWHGQPDAEAHHIYRVVGNSHDRFLGIG